MVFSQELLAAFWQNRKHLKYKYDEINGVEGDRTPNLRRARAAFSQLNYDPDFRIVNFEVRSVKKNTLSLQ